MCITKNRICVTVMMIAGTVLAGCAQTQGPQNPWAGISSSSQQQPAYEGSYVDSKMDRQVNRQQSHVNQRINNETDQAVDSAVGDMLDSIFD